MTEKDFYKSLALFILYDVDENTKETAIDIYNRWRKKTGIIVKGPNTLCWILEYFDSQKNFRREALIEASVSDGFISSFQAQEIIQKLSR